MVDIVGTNARHRVLIRYQPEGGDERWDDLDYHDVMEITSRVRDLLAPKGWVIWDYAGPVAAIDTLDELGD
jgi:hypothetical protein